MYFFLCFAFPYREARNPPGEKNNEDCNLEKVGYWGRKLESQSNKAIIKSS